MSGNPILRTLAVAASVALLVTALTAAVGLPAAAQGSYCLPHVTIAGPDQLLFSQDLILQGSADCQDSSLQVPPLTYQWEVSGVSRDELDPATRDTPSLFIPARSSWAAPEEEYTATLTVTFGAPFSGMSSDATHTWRYLSTPLVVIVAGGSLAAYAGEPVTLDASPSYDPDAPGTALPASAFSWKVSNAGEPGTVLYETAGVDQLHLDGPGWMLPGKDYWVTVRVTDPTTYGRDPGESSIMLTTYAAVIPQVSIFANAEMINPDARLRLQGSVTDLSSSDVTYTWSEETGKLTADDLVNPQIIASRPRTLMLVIRENQLVAGETYEFRLRVRDNLSTGVGYAQVTIVVNTPPEGGSLTVSPETGVALETLFHLTASGWSDDQEPLHYSFAYKVVGSDEEIGLTQILPVNHADVYLPAGDLKVIVRVYDSLGASTTDQISMTVRTSPQQPQTIAFPALGDHTYGDGPLALEATASSGLGVSYTTDGQCALNDNGKLKLTGAGSCTVTASQAGDGAYLPADPVSVTFSIKKAPLTCTAWDAERINLIPNPDLDRATCEGFVNGEDWSDLGGTLTCETPAWKESPAGEYPITCSGKTSPDYGITWVDGTLTVVYVPPITYDEDLDVSGDETIRDGDRVKGNVAASDGVFKVEGIVDGNIVQTGTGDVIVNAGTVKGNIDESGDGDVVVNHGGSVSGNIDEHGTGSVLIYQSSTVKGNVSEAYNGRVLVADARTLVSGNVIEAGKGDLDVKAGGTVKGNVCEQVPNDPSDGTVNVDASSSVGNIKCPKSSTSEQRGGPSERAGLLLCPGVLEQRRDQRAMPSFAYQPSTPAAISLAYGSPKAPQRGPHRLLRRVAHAHVPRVLGEVGGGHVAPVALVDGDIDVEVEAGVGEAEAGHRPSTVLLETFAALVWPGRLSGTRLQQRDRSATHRHRHPPWTRVQARQAGGAGGQRHSWDQIQQAPEHPGP